MKIEFFKKRRNFKKGGISSGPDFFWNILLLIALLIILTSFVLGFILFRQVNKEPILSLEDINEKSQTLDKEKLEKVLEYFSDRKNKSTDILNSPSPIVDPSL